MHIHSILQRIATGDRSAFALLVQRFQGPLFGYLGRMGLTQSVGEEIAQETFLRAWQKLNTYDPAQAEFSTWLFTIARNLALHELQRAASKYEVNDDDALVENATPGNQPADTLSRSQQQHRMQKALRMLPITDRSALALAYFNELDLISIARIEGCKTNTIKIRLHRAKQRLRQILENTHE